MTTADDRSVAILHRYVRHQEGGEPQAAPPGADLRRQLAHAQAEARKARAAADAAARRLALMDIALAQAKREGIQETYAALRDERTATYVRKLSGVPCDDAFLPAWAVGKFPFDKPTRHLHQVMPQIMRMLAPLRRYRQKRLDELIDDCGNVGSENT